MKKLVKSVMLKALWADGIRRLRGNAREGRVDEQAIAELWLAWDNPQWSATPEMLVTIAKLAIRPETQCIVECGAGISSIVLGIVCAATTKRIISLESDARWHESIFRTVRKLGLSNVDVRLAPLTSDGGVADWYDPAALRDVAEIDLFLCDGPPGDTRGGRTGCIPHVRGRLSRQAKIVVDDTSRPPERALAGSVADLAPSTCS